jgi:2-polyprenyl-6-methoxyphenol hydroxylase-like FAD-dependent oxidoreductase
MAHYDTDVLVIGGGPAGLAAAVAARRKGFHVVVADATVPPIDKACGEGLMPEALDALEKLGIALPQTAGLPFFGIRFVEGNLSAQASFPLAGGPAPPKGHGLAVRRTTLHAALVSAAIAAGAELRWGAAVTGLSSDGAFFDAEHVSCRWLVAADGGQSRVRQWAGIRTRESSVRYGFRRHYKIAPWADRVEVHWANDFQIYIAPVGVKEVCVALLARDPHLRIDDAFESFPDLAERLAGTEHLSEERGGISAMRRVAAVTQGRIALIGDASGSVDAITGQGLCLAFQQALALADALADDNLDAYETAHRKIMRRPRRMAQLLLLLDRYPLLRAETLRVLAGQPKLFDALLAFHVGAVSKTAASLRSAIRVQLGSGAASRP